MLTLLGSLLGFLSSLLPEAMKIYKNKQDHAQELAILDKQIEMSKSQGNQRLEEIKAQTSASEVEAVHAFQNQPTGISWVDGLNSLVRPTVTYSFFGLFLLLKIGLFMTFMSSPNTDWYKALTLLWDTETAGLFATIISFYFGTRVWNKK